MLGRCTLDLDPVDRGIMFDSVSWSTVGLFSSRLYLLSLLWHMHDFESSGIVIASMCLDSLKLSGCARTLHKGCVLVPPFLIPRQSRGPPKGL
ncbi:hypothetical protein M9H77_14584 [Catharanthus roseus]|uniref:Uncharacterized protein n=1 Tax=Catharanthus roseus TaxID=4058 RepID=A0ACC0BNM9_CATRO|nr:hypothetical protein M9H77_14584 [Catharanthus roseus]